MRQTLTFVDWLDGLWEETIFYLWSALFIAFFIVEVVIGLAIFVWALRILGVL